MQVEYKQQITFPTMRHALIVMAFCTLPHLTTAPWWFLILAIVAISYRLLASYYHSRVLPLWFRAFVIVSVLILLRIHYDSFVSPGFFMGTLVTFFWLKLIEAHSIRDLRVVILVSFYVIFTSLISNTELWVLPYMILATIGIMSLLVRLEVQQVIHWKQMSIRSFKLLLIALPLTVLMFFVFPRISEPLWRINVPSTGTTGFGESMHPGSIVTLFKDDTTAMRVTFKGKPKIEDYWHGLVLNNYDGVNWTAEAGTENFITLPLLPNKESGDYEVILEAHQKIWLFYSGFPSAGWPKLHFTPSLGLIRYDGKPINQRFAYGLSTRKPFYRPLNPVARFQNLQLPANANPLLQQWSKETMNNAKGDINLFIKNIQEYIQKEPFWYRLESMPIGNDNAQLDRFWFTTREGYCEHYAAAVTFIFRAAGIPARVVLGYFGGEWNPFAKYLNIKQKDAHAWLEYWQNGEGWKRLDPTTFILPSRIDETIRNINAHDKQLYTNWSEYRLHLPWLEQARLSIDSVKYFWERWLLFYNQERQIKLFQSFGLGSWRFGELLRTWILLLFIILLCGGIWYQYKQKKAIDPLIREYRKLQRELRRLQIPTTPPSSLLQQWRRISQKYPKMATIVHSYIKEYEFLRLRIQVNKMQKKKETILLFKKLRYQLKKIRNTQVVFD
ncbi:transglutaminase domain-containing protein (plasmid) [Legionella adelaidensis]|uniref:Transglutaminase n=1 Tax=Legionella adelaidensis TaxID=45056 RepID=A0A0W0R4X5_9GAMM|nr:DUF3488 and transglutaminase-like domain-containing protein [Legionella adelaidensis]KTC66143.1 transglutaminase [Legionella adelaidensis]VEH85655.1 transglutaminase domain-containing protein [Legionella adelaidensis]